MDEKSGLYSKMKAVRELKGEYLIGSQDAFYYLKAMSDYEKILQELNKDPLIKVKLSINDLSFLQEKIIWCANIWLDITTLERNTVDNFCLGWKSIHEVIYPRGKSEYGEYVWNIDLLLILSHVLKNLEKVANLLSNFKLLCQYFLLIDCFILEVTGERFSGASIIADPKFHMGGDDFWQQINSFEEPLSLSQKEVEELKKAILAKDIPECYQIWKRSEINQINSYITAWENKKKFSWPTLETLEYLSNPNKLMERASRELTLGRFEIERKVAIGVVYGFMDDFPNLTVKKLIIIVIEQLQRNLQRRQERLKRLKELNAPWIIIEDEEKLVRSGRYEYLSVLQNERWLERYFSS